MKLDCGNCGAVLSVEKFLKILECNYCQTLYYPVWKSKELSIDLVQSKLEEQCPICSVVLIEGNIGDVSIEACQQCHGLLLDSRQLLELIRYLRKDRTDLRREPERLEQGDLERKILCPKCETDMTVSPYYGPGDFVIDYCVACKSVWLDGGELEKAVTIQWNGYLWK